MAKEEPESGQSWSDADRRGFGGAVLAARTARGLSQQELADRLGAAASWVSHVENAKLTPSPERVALLALHLGPEVENAAPGGQSKSEDSPEAVAFACLWRARADLLARLAYKTSPPGARELRLDRMARRLSTAAALHPTVREFARSGALLPIGDIVPAVPKWLRRALLVELAMMKIDAPYETGFHNEHRRELLRFTVNDFGLTSEAYDALSTAMINPPVKPPWWQELQPIGGTLGRSHALSAEGFTDLPLLLAHDPVCWLGIEYIGGRWLVAPAVSTPEPRSEAPSGTAHAALPDRLSLAGTPTGVLRAGSPATLIGSVMLGPVLGGAIGAVAGAAMASRAAQHRATAAGVTEEDAISDGVEPLDETPARATGKLAEAFGRHWVKVEVAKLVAHYSTFPDVAAAGGDGGLPAADVAKQHLAATAAWLESCLNEEIEASGTRDGNKNDRVRELHDLHVAFHNGAERIPDR